VELITDNIFLGRGPYVSSFCKKVSGDEKV
jgi:hypothetical protein